MCSYKVAAYIRLSKDDNYTESDSINNQKNIIKKYIDTKDDLDLVDYYIDNGYTGTNFDRPAFVKMCLDIVNNKINCVIVKDLSRFGRNMGWMKIYLGETFPEYNIRFISINDNLDSQTNPNYTDELDFSLHALIYEQYSIDISKKVKTIKHLQQSRGDFIGVSAPYGYLKDPNDCHKFVVDEYAANIVRRIFEMALHCKSKNEIADILNSENILTPSKYKSEVTRVTSSKTIKADKWNNKIISEILKNPTYIGTLIQGKNCKTNRKLPKMVKTDSKSWKICTNHHEPIIDKKTFETVQNILNYSPIVQEDDEFLISKLKCGECHGGFYRRKAKGIFYYWCKSSFRKTGCTLKSIRKDILENMVLCDINSKYNKHYRKLTKEIVNNYVEVVELYNSNKIKIIYKK